MTAVTIRARRREDLPRLVEILGEQQPSSRYPFRWPLPFPVEQFIARQHELAAFVAEVDGALAGHVCVQSVAGSAAVNGIDGGELGRAWSAGHDRPVEELAAVSALFTALFARGRGAGGALLEAAVGWIRGQGLAPCLDVVQHHSPALAIYEAHGWVRIAEVRPPWLPAGESSVIAMVLPS